MLNSRNLGFEIVIAGTRKKWRESGFPINLLADPIVSNLECDLSQYKYLAQRLSLMKKINEGSGYRAYNNPSDIVNQYVLRFPMVYSDRGVYKIARK